MENQNDLKKKIWNVTIQIQLGESINPNILDDSPAHTILDEIMDAMEDAAKKFDVFFVGSQGGIHIVPSHFDAYDIYSNLNNPPLTPPSSLTQ